MFTSIDKALIALIMAALALVNLLSGHEWFGGVSEEAVAWIVAILTPILVWAIPNKAT